MGLVDPQRATALIGHRVIDPTDVLIGSCSAVLDDESDTPHWLAVSLADGDRAVLVPLAGAAEADDAVRVTVDREAAAAAPDLHPTDRLSRADQQLLWTHYGSAPDAALWASVTPLGSRPSARASRLVGLLTVAIAVGAIAAGRRRPTRRHRPTNRRRTEPAQLARQRTRDTRQRAVSAARSTRRAARDRAVRLDSTRRRTMRLITLALGMAAGYVMGAKAGRERFDQIKHQAQNLARKPQVQQVKQRMTATGGPPTSAYSATPRAASAEPPGSPPHPRQEPQLSDAAGMPDSPP
jgi:hypothetical protein